MGTWLTNARYFHGEHNLLTDLSMQRHLGGLSGTYTSGSLLFMPALVCLLLSFAGCSKPPTRAQVFPIVENWNCGRLAIDDSLNVWLADCNVSNSVRVFSNKLKWSTVSLPKTTGMKAAAARHNIIYYVGDVDIPGGWESLIVKIAGRSISRSWYFKKQASFVGLAVDRKGNIWLADSNGKIAKISAGVRLKVIPIPGATPNDITIGTDDQPWFTASGAAEIGSITRKGRVLSYKLPRADSDPEGLTVGPDEAIWFSERTAHKIGRLSRSGKITEFSLPDDHAALSIASGSDKNLWFTEPDENLIGCITMSGRITEYRNPGISGFLTGIVADKNGSLWIIAQSGNTIWGLERPTRDELIKIEPDFAHTQSCPSSL